MYAAFLEAHKLVFIKYLLYVAIYVCMSHTFDKPQENLHCVERFL